MFQKLMTSVIFVCRYFKTWRIIYNGSQSTDEKYIHNRGLQKLWIYEKKVIAI